MEQLTADLVVVGAGAAGLMAAAAARRLGDHVIVVETSARVGGSTASGPGVLWLPANPVGAKAGFVDTPSDAEAYLESMLGALDARQTAFLRTAPKLTRWMVSSNIPLHVVRGAADAHSELPGAAKSGRSIQAGAFDRRLLGDTDATLAPSQGLVRDALARLPLPRRTSTGGESLVAHLLHRAVANGVELWLNTAVTELLTDADGLVGVRVDREGQPITISAQRVLLASGGFEADQTMRDEHLPLPTDPSWTINYSTNSGGLMRLALGIGAAASGLDDAWWLPVTVAEGRAHPIRVALDHPHSMLVDSAGDRYLDETTADDALGRAMYTHSRSVRAVPSYLIMDNRHRQHCQLGPWAPGNTPRTAIEDGEITRAGTLNDLAQATGLDRAGLLGSVVRFNNFAAKGTDSDFGRGRPAASAKGGRTNASLGKIDKPPFWAVKVYPGDAGTKGGLATDASWRVLRADGSVIEGLYACGGTAASVFAGGDPAPGAALGEAMVGAFLAVTDHRSDRRREL